MTPERKNELTIKVKEFNNKFFKDRIKEKKLEIKKLKEDCKRLQEKINKNNIEINLLNENR
jgi:hypothetical protein